MEAHDAPAGEQAALRRLATLVADEAPDAELFAAVAESMGALLDADKKARLERFAELVATEVANSEARAELRRLVDEQAALRRVATLVARGVPEAEVFAAVTEEVVRALGVDVAGMSRYEPDGVQTIVAVWPPDRPHLQAGTRLPVSGDESIAGQVQRTGEPARIDDWEAVPGAVSEQVRRLDVRSSVASPIVVAGRLWGVMIVDARRDHGLPEGVEQRLASFIELVATAIANAHTRAQVQRLAEEQAALRRVASQVARETTPEALFAAVAEEVGVVLRADVTRIFRYEMDGSVTVLASWGEAEIPTGRRMPLDGENVTSRVRATGQAARIESYADAHGPLAEQAHALGLRSSVGAPIVVEGRLWGVAVVGTTRSEPLPPGAEARVAEFTELLATAVANAASRAELTASRARVVAAADAERRRIERNLHDGAQQRLVSLGLRLRVAQAGVPAGDDVLRGRLDEAIRSMREVVDELQELSRGLHPAALSTGGLEPALAVLARRSAVPVELDVAVRRRLPDAVEVAAYYVVSEALANAAKHAGASCVTVRVVERDGVLALTIGDDGVGGADPARGSGLVGLRDRVDAIGGALGVDSPPGVGTTLRVELPVDPT
ncbi:GAF domain-containing protein [Solirubrobacter phytolaccae]|uniref:histidine kinase n=1 Tax=Solirubrobacter phytolaccae TaxID=1404360 RepID=A0A9X3SEG0_9ACTN|nr:GAF domain-containing protein [Solirubrobacter phytolaccae]MDA0184820.1 GAF domain-containing protein [Solirubrobacter phytolaccae]